MLKDFYEEPPKINGIAQPFAAHYQEVVPHGTGTLAHRHNYIEMIYCVDGIFEAWLDGKSRKFSKGSLVVINSMEMHSIYSISDKTGKYFWVKFLPEILYTSAASTFDIKYVMPFLLNSSKHHRIFSSEEISKTSIPELIHEIFNEFQKKDYGYELSVKTCISRIFLWIIRYWHNSDVDLSTDIPFDDDMIKRMQIALDYISENYNDDITAYDIADMCNLSYSYFSRIFKQYMKKSFSEYLTFIRISNAEKLLSSSDMPITEIAVECGFSTSSYFIKTFRHYKNMSPLQFRKSIKQNN